MTDRSHQLSAVWLIQVSRVWDCWPGQRGRGGLTTQTSPETPAVLCRSASRLPTPCCLVELTRCTESGLGSPACCTRRLIHDCPHKRYTVRAPAQAFETPSWLTEHNVSCCQASWGRCLSGG